MVSTPGPSKGGRRITKGTKVRERERGGHQRGWHHRGGDLAVGGTAGSETRRTRRGGGERGGDLRSRGRRGRRPAPNSGSRGGRRRGGDLRSPARRGRRPAPNGGTRVRLGGSRERAWDRMESGTSAVRPLAALIKNFVRLPRTLLRLCREQFQRDYDPLPIAPF